MHRISINVLSEIAEAVRRGDQRVCAAGHVLGNRMADLSASDQVKQCDLVAAAPWELAIPFVRT